MLFVRVRFDIKCHQQLLYQSKPSPIMSTNTAFEGTTLDRWCYINVYSYSSLSYRDAQVCIFRGAHLVQMLSVNSAQIFGKNVKFYFMFPLVC